MKAVSLFDYDSPEQKLLAEAAELGDRAKVQNLLDQGISPNSARDGSGSLLLACSRGHLDLVRILLDAGADLHRHGIIPSALQVAATCGYLPIVRLLIERGADINDTSRAEPDLGKYLEIPGQLYDALASTSGLDLDLPNPLTGAARTALACAAWMGHVGIVRHMMEIRRGRARKDKAGFCSKESEAFLIAVKEGKAHVAGCMLEFLKSSDFEEQQQLLLDAMEWAAFFGHLEVVEALLSSPVFSNCKRYTQRALQAASDRGKKEIVDLLTRSGVQLAASSTN